MKRPLEEEYSKHAVSVSAYWHGFPPIYFIPSHKYPIWNGNSLSGGDYIQSPLIYKEDNEVKS